MRHKKNRMLLLWTFSPVVVQRYMLLIIFFEVEHTHRRCILITNNEIGEKKEKAMQKAGYRPGDAEWEAIGIARHTTWPRTVCRDFTRGHLQNSFPICFRNMI